MESSTSVQQIFFQHIKDHLPTHISLVDEVAGLLHISIDSAYRRIRAEKALSFDEIRTLCSHFRLSLDQLFHLETDTLLFGGRFINGNDFDFNCYLEDICRLLTRINSHQRKEMLLMSKDLPIFYHFLYPELAAFKVFFWMKTILQYPQYSRQRFSIDDIPPSISQVCTRIAMEYNKIPSQEIWHAETVHATLRQIEYYRETKVLASGQDLDAVYDCLEKAIDHVEAQTELGFKFLPSPTPGREPIKGALFQCYINEFALGDNSFLIHLDDHRLVVLNHSVLNTIRTSDTYFTRCTEEHFQNIIRRSTPISGVGEKERNKFFNIIREKIAASRNS
jgi:hypothetical protein